MYVGRSLCMFRLRIFQEPYGRSSAVERNIGVARSASVLPKESTAVGFVNSLSYVWRLLREFDTGVNVSGISVHRVTGGEIAFNEFVGIATQGFTVLASSRSTLVSIDDGVPRSKQIPERTGTMDVKEVGELLIVSLTRLVRVHWAQYIIFSYEYP